MSRRFIVEQRRMAVLRIGQGVRSGLSAVLLSPVLRWRLVRSGMPRLLIAPQELRTVDPTRAADIVTGRYSMGGKTVDVGAVSPFSVAPPSRAWSEALFGFAWLRHLRAADRPAGARTARLLVASFLKDRTRFSAEAMDGSVAARRLLSFLGQAPLILDGADRGEYLAFVRAVGWHGRMLMAQWPGLRDGLPRLLAAIAATQAGLCLEGAGQLQKGAARRLCRELSRQILPDGGHVSRNPGVLVDLLLDLLPLRQSYAARGLAPPQELIAAIDRMMPMLRFFRHADGTLAAFNGMGYTPADLLATLRTYDDVRGKPVRQANHSGYQRVEAGDAVLLVDTGKPPPPAFSHEAHAGTLAFEFSAGTSRIVVNCGAPGAGRESWRQMARVTAAHSTVSPGDLSSAVFAPAEGLGAGLGFPIIDGPQNVVVDRVDDAGATTLRARHDGFLPALGLIHERDLSLAADGQTLSGADRFFDAKGAAFRGPANLLLRFHLHAGIAANLDAAGETASLRLPTGQVWTFTASGQAVHIEESVSLANPEGPRAALQLVVTVPRGRFDVAEEIGWTFQRRDV